MSRKLRAAFRSRRVSKSQVRQAQVLRIRQRVAASGTWILPAVPALLEAYVATCAELFHACGRQFASEELPVARGVFEEALGQAYAASQRSKITLKFQAEAAQPVGFEVSAQASSIAETYERWVDEDDKPLFGAHADERVLALAAELGDVRQARVLDLGAGTGRNALALARRGHPVDAVELTPKFVELIRSEAAREGLPVRVIQRDIFGETQELAGYALLVASEVVPDFRGTADLRRLFELAARVLDDGGFLVMNLHLAAHGYTPDRAAREFAEQCYSAVFTASEVARAAAGLPLVCVANDSVHDYERARLPEGAWPPTPWYVNWITGLDIYEISPSESPVELRWLVFKKHSEPSLNVSAPRKRVPAPDALRQAVLRRLKRRAVASGMLILPAVPVLLDDYEAMCFQLFDALGRELSIEQRASARTLLSEALNEAFAASPRSNVVVSYEAAMGADLSLSVASDPLPLGAAYEEWLEASPAPLFGMNPDARVLTLLGSLGEPARTPILDVGAGLGRNALALSRRGYPVDALEISPRFVAHVRAEVAREKLAVRVFEHSVFEENTDLRSDYALLVVSGVVGDFRSQSELAALFGFAARVLAPGGLLVMSVHLTKNGAELPDELARQWGQQCCAMCFSRSELEQARAGLPLGALSDDSAFDFEAEHLPEGQFPPTPVYAEWALGQHMYALDAEDVPLELRWLVFTKTTEPR
jgi:SAM-dependent methyltransferase